MTIALLISVSSPVIIAGIHKYLLPPPILYSLCLNQAVHLVVVFYQTFIPEKSRPLLALYGLDCYSFPLIFITGHGDTKRHPKGFL